MPITCNAFAAQTVGQTQQLAACRAPHVANLSDHQILPEQFLLLVLDSLERLRTNPGTLPSLAEIPACDAALVLQNASCSMLTNTPAFSLEPAQLQALILYMLNEALCT